MKSFRKVLSVVLALLTVFSLFTTTVNAEIVTGKNKITTNYFRHAAFKSNGVIAQWVDVNGDGSITDEEVVYCLERGVPSTTEISTFWEGETKIEKSAFWQSLSFGQRQSVVRTLLHGYPNTTTSYGLTGIDTKEKIYAVQILVWEFTSGAREYNDFSHTIPDSSYDFEKAFNVVSGTNGADRFIAMTETNGKFQDAYNYYCKLLDAVSTHVSTPSRSGNTYDVAPAGSGSFYTYTQPGTYKITNSMFSEFSFKSSETNSVAVSQSGDTLTLNIKQACNTVIVEGTKKSSVKNNTLSAPVMIESGAGKQKLMYGTLEDPVSFFMRVQAEPAQGGIGVMKVSAEGLPMESVKSAIYEFYEDVGNKPKSQ